MTPTWDITIQNDADARQFYVEIPLDEKGETIKLATRTRINILYFTKMAM